MRRFRFDGGPLDPESERFDDWLTETVALACEERSSRLIRWFDAPGARDSHPREEHLLPLHVVAGAAHTEPGTQVFRDELIGSAQSAFRFGRPVHPN